MSERQKEWFCYEEWFCFLMVPGGLIAGGCILGCMCGFLFSCCKGEGFWKFLREKFGDGSMEEEEEKVPNISIR